MTESKATWRKHPDLWLADGNVVLVCQDVGYRVNESVLRLHSPVFSDLFHVASTDAEGAKVLFMKDDAEDMYHFLKAMFLRYYGRMKSEPPFALIASLLRMATKYMFAELRTEMIDILAPFFPTSLHAYPALDALAAAYRPAGLTALAAVDLALTCDVPGILPSASYLVALADVRTSLPTDDALAAAWRACMVFRDHLAEDIEDAVDTRAPLVPCGLVPCVAAGALRWRAPQCVRGDQCHGVPHAARHHLEKTCRRLTEDVLARGAPPLPGTCYTCAPCAEALQAYWDALRRRIWEALPVLCGYQDWGHIVDEQAAAREGAGAAKMV